MNPVLALIICVCVCLVSINYMFVVYKVDTKGEYDITIFDMVVVVISALTIIFSSIKVLDIFYIISCSVPTIGV